MPRPDLPIGFIEECEALFDAAEEIPAPLKEGELRKFFLETWISSIVLRASLLEAGCQEVLADQILFSHGQLSPGRDPWDVAEYCFSQYRKGYYPPPGEDLLMASTLGKPIPLVKIPVE